MADDPNVPTPPPSLPDDISAAASPTKLREAHPNPAVHSPHDSTDDLRQVQLSLSYRCPYGAYTAECPFGKLRGISHASRKSLLDGLDYERLLKLFDLAMCPCPADPRRWDFRKPTPPVV